MDQLQVAGTQLKKQHQNKRRKIGPRPLTVYEIDTTKEGLTALVAKRGRSKIRSVVLVSSSPDTLRILTKLLPLLEQGVTLKRNTIIREAEDGQVTVEYQEAK